VGTGQFESLSAGEQRALLARVGTPPPQCRVFQLEPAPGASGASVFRMLDAIVVAYATRTPTWIGYTGVVLKDGYERDPTKPGYAESAARWWADHGIRQGLCALDVDSGHWRVLP